jgi:hypothetical protein
MDAESNSKIITLGDYIRSVAEKEKRQQQPNVDLNTYPVYPEDDGYDTPKNPYGNH